MKPRQIAITLAAAAAAFAIAFVAAGAGGSAKAADVKLAQPKALDVAQAAVTAGASAPEALPALKQEPVKRKAAKKPTPASNTTNAPAVQSTATPQAPASGGSGSTGTVSPPPAKKPSPPKSSGGGGGVSGGGQG